MNPLNAFIITFTFAIGTTVLLVPIAIRLGHRYGAVDKPGGRRHHKGVISRLGGISIYGGFMVGIVIAQLLPIARFDPYEIIRFAGLALGVTFVFIVGIIDDFLDLSPLWQALAQIFAAAIGIFFLIFIERVNIPFVAEPLEWGRWVTVSISLVWMVVMMNTINFLDGLDGLAGGVSLIAGIMLFVHSAFRLMPAQTSVSLLPLALAGACLGFLFYNFTPAKIFMGSSGSYVLGYTLGALSIIGGAKMATILLALGLPLLDVVWLVVTRMAKGKNPMQGDRGHLHFRLLDLGMSQRRIVLAYYAFCAFFGTLTLMTGSRTFKLIVLVMLICIALGGFYLLQRMEQKHTLQHNAESG